MNGRHGCPKNLEEHNDCDTKLGTQICRCAPAAQAPTPQPTTPPPTAVPPGYDYHPQACVLGSNVEQLHGMGSPAECAAKCDAATFGCIGFEFYHEYNGDTDLYKAGDCNLQAGQAYRSPNARAFEDFRCFNMSGHAGCPPRPPGRAPAFPLMLARN